MRRAGMVGLALAGVGAGAATAARRRSRARIEGEFRKPRAPSGGPGERPPGVAGYPLTYDRVEDVIAYHAADLDAVRALLPTPYLHPVRLPRDRTIVAIAAGRYLEGTAPGTDPRLLPYGEVIVAAAVTTRPAPPLVPLALPSIGIWGATGAFVLHNPVSHRAARDAAREYGLPAFVADLAFDDGLTWTGVAVSDEDGAILDLTVRATGPARPTAERMVTFSARDGSLYRSTVTALGTARTRLGRAAGSLELGDHPVARELRALGLSPEPIVVRQYLDLRMIIPVAEVVGTAGPYPGYAGTGRERGRYTLRRPGADAVEVAVAG